MRMAEALAKFGLEVTFFVQKHPLSATTKKQIFSYYGIQTPFPLTWIKNHNLPYSLEFAFQEDHYFINHALSYLQNMKPDVVISSTLYGASSCIKHKLPVIIDSLEVMSPHEKSVVKTLEKSQWVKGFIVQTALMEKKLRGNEAIQNSVLLCPNAATALNLNPKKKLLPDPLNINRNTRVGFGGNLSQEKGIAMLIETAKQLPEVNFFVAGGGKQAIDITTQKLSAKGIHNVRLLGFLSQKKLQRFYGKMDLFFLPFSPHNPYLPYSSSHTLYEMASFGKPMIISSAYPLPVDLENKAMKTVEEYTANSFATAIQEAKQELEQSTPIKELISFAKKNQWLHRAQTLNTFLTEKV